MCGKEMAGHEMKELLSTGMLVSRAERNEDMQNVNCMLESLPAERKSSWPGGGSPRKMGLTCIEYLILTGLNEDQ